MKSFASAVSAFVLAAAATSASAGVLPVFNGWTQLANDDTPNASYYVNPGYGGQNFDAEYLFYKQEGNSLSIALQTGFDISSLDGQLYSDGHRYFTGDLALSFDGNNSNYEYAVDFGNRSKGYFSGATISSQGINLDSGVDTAGLYKVTSWNNDIYYTQSAPYAMSGGSLLLAANGGNFQEGSGWVGGEYSFFNIFTFDLSNIANLGQDFALDVHWTMSCGNDALNGHVNLTQVPEPMPLLLFGLGLAGLLVSRRKV